MGKKILVPFFPDHSAPGNRSLFFWTFRLPVLILKYVSNSDFENCSPEMDALVRIDREITFASNLKYAMCEEK